VRKPDVAEREGALERAVNCPSSVQEVLRNMHSMGRSIEGSITSEHQPLPERDHTGHRADCPAVTDQSADTLPYAANDEFTAVDTRTDRDRWSRSVPIEFESRAYGRDPVGRVATP
jgi:hypothetical protein